MADLSPLYPHIRKAFEEFFIVLSNKFDMNVEKIQHVYSLTQEHEGKSGKKEEKKKEEKKVKPLNKKTLEAFEKAKQFVADDSDMGKLTIDKLKEKCREKKLKLTGKKADLIERLKDPTNPENKTGGKRVKKSLFKTRDISKIISQLQGAVSSLAVRKNSEGKYVHLETNLVFDPHTRKVIGRWKDNQVKWLTKSDVEMCLTLGVQFELPENLDLGIVKVVDKTVEEVLGDDDFKDDDESDEEEEEISDDEY